ncbi:beta-glucoside-specific PTS transporter subunit IIABC [Streptococcus merionis]|uniref:PTS system sucrose-specific EIIBCA component n=1 Tax=Streptococcus merionis TaxID=400065 RepID=A0A239SXU6_9STRE|nr:beta-glucoside-specific PTS transporter subunit IIABC [Streptococcus merionis]SNU89413.1 PTS system protein [Streptococcus merionis]
MDYKQTAKEIVANIGGKGNVTHLEHCSTRLRFTLIDNSKANVAALEKIDGVMGVRQNAQTQIIIGNEVNEVYDQVQPLLGNLSNNTSSGKGQKQSWGAIFLDFLVAVFQPVVPAVAGGGVLKSVLMLFAWIGWMDKTSITYTIFNQIGDAPLYFLPLLVAYNTAKKLRVNELVAASAVGALLLPNMTAMLTEGPQLFGFTIQNIAYPYQVFPAILSTLFFAMLEKVLTKYTPKPIRIFFVPMVALAITVPVTLLILGPLGFNLGQLLATAVVTLHHTLGWLATGILAAILPFMVVTGMHKAMLPYAIEAMKAGFETLYLPASLAHNISESGATFAVALKTKDTKLRATAVSAGISALFGITEPALYGVTIQHRKVLYSVVASSFFGGIAIGLTALKGFALVGPGLATMTMYIDPNGGSNFMNAWIAFAISIVLSFIFTFITFKDTATEEIQDKTEKVEVTFVSPVDGEVVALESVNDSVFASKLVGDGLAIVPSNGTLYAPVAGEISLVYETGHAIALTAENGAEILFHVGIDTVQLQGKGFYPKVEAGAIVEPGDVLLEFDIPVIEGAGYDTTVMALVTNQNDYELNIKKSGGQVAHSEEVMIVSRKDEVK